MAAAEKRTVSLQAEQVAFIDEKIATGAYGSASEVVDAGLRALRERDEALESWLAREVATTYDAIVADPSLGKPAETVFAEIRARHAKRLRQSP
jgi:antitoxin ParD1/3/4